MEWLNKNLVGGEFDILLLVWLSKNKRSHMSFVCVHYVDKRAICKIVSTAYLPAKLLEQTFFLKEGGGGMVGKSNSMIRLFSEGGGGDCHKIKCTNMIVFWEGRGDLNATKTLNGKAIKAVTYS